MSVYEQPLSPFQDDLFLPATRREHALDEPAPAPASPAAQRPAGGRSRPGLTGDRPRHRFGARHVAGGALVAAAVAAGAVGLSMAGGGHAAPPPVAAVRPPEPTPLPANRPVRHAPPRHASRPPARHDKAARPAPRPPQRRTAPVVRHPRPQPAPRQVVRTAHTRPVVSRPHTTSTWTEEFSP
jgi:hypothetical protein